ncbi:alginate O-acetyltransferase AlgX-related protein [Azospirillum soli]|uniref:alginate O-acetyltransferase AlgX-related protein n=1 Tax=Azospirillum soli TaxID=1304799 RepID=UPI001AE142D1|nr:hypothetical protein [Azospirillum soli]MBP2313487.1 hypothetical protein [Azospirillum soli]
MTNRFGGFNGFMLRALALVSAVVLPVSYALDPPDGDLTRLGGYAENRFGPTAPQAIFAPPLVEKARAGATYDVMVVGDGFSQPDPADRHTPYGHYWTDHLRNLTGLTVGVRHLDEEPLADYLASADFRERPPRVLVFQVTERELPARTDGLPEGTAKGARTAIPAPMAARPLGHAPQPWPRAQARAWSAPPVGHALDMLSKALPRAVLDRPVTPVEERTLAYAGLFSSAAATSSLFHAGDFEPWRADRELLVERRQALRGLQAAVEANGVTRFLLLVAPDKGTVYADFLLGGAPVRSAVEEVLAADPALRMAPLASGLRALVAGGVIDLYKPNDSRWGTEGHLYAARTVYAALERMGVLATADKPNVATLPCKPVYPDCASFQVQTD